MYFSKTGYLCREVVTLDKFNRPTKTEFEKRAVFCEDKGVKRTEFYQAQAAGYKPELCVDILMCEYDKERYFELDGTMYKVLRTYPVHGEKIELVCQGMAAGNGEEK